MDPDKPLSEQGRLAENVGNIHQRYLPGHFSFASTSRKHKVAQAIKAKRSRPGKKKGPDKGNGHKQGRGTTQRR